MPKVPTALVADVAATLRTFDEPARVEVSIAPSTDLVDQTGRGRARLGVIEHPALVDPLTGTDVVSLPLTLLVPRVASGRRAGPVRAVPAHGPAVSRRHHVPTACRVRPAGRRVRARRRRPRRRQRARRPMGPRARRGRPGLRAHRGPHPRRDRGGAGPSGDDSIRLRLRCLRSSSADVPDGVLDAVATRIAVYAAGGQVTS